MTLAPFARHATCAIALLAALALPYSADAQACREVPDTSLSVAAERLRDISKEWGAIYVPFVSLSKIVGWEQNHASRYPEAHTRTGFHVLNDFTRGLNVRLQDAGVLILDVCRLRAGLLNTSSHPANIQGLSWDATRIIHAAAWVDQYITQGSETADLIADFQAARSGGPVTPERLASAWERLTAHVQSPFVPPSDVTEIADAFRAMIAADPGALAQLEIADAATHAQITDFRDEIDRIEVEYDLDLDDLDLRITHLDPDVDLINRRVRDVVVG